MNGSSVHYDYIIVGAGSAGCVLANRLSENPDNRVLLLEDGPEDSNWMIHMPKGNGKTLSSTRYASHFQTDRQLIHGQERWSRGKVLGGSSSVNGMIWVRGQPEDYDRIAALGNSGWSWDDMLPYFRKLEDHALGGSALRGAGGPVKVKPHPRSDLGDAFISSGMALGLTGKEDLNDLDQEGIGYLQVNIDAGGRRSSAAKAFLQPVRHRQNLHTITGVRITKVVVDGSRAIGVRGVREGRDVEFRTHGEVILSAGAIETPRLLQLSGVGPAEHLNRHEIPVVLDAPQVGRNMREHYLLTLNYVVRHSADSQNSCYSGWGLMRSLLSYWLFRRGPMSHAACTAAAFVRSDPTLNRPDGQIMFSPWTRDYIERKFGKYPGMNVFPYLLRPESTGSVLIQGPEPTSSVAISPNYLSTDYDRTHSIALVRYVRRLMSVPPLADRIVSETEETAWAQSDDQILDAYLRQGQCGFHACGTVAMGETLDTELRVRGIQGLRVIDLSVLPELISGNTNAPVMAIAWRAADLIERARKSGSNIPRVEMNQEGKGAATSVL